MGLDLGLRWCSVPAQKLYQTQTNQYTGTSRGSWSERTLGNRSGYGFETNTTPWTAMEFAERFRLKSISSTASVCEEGLLYKTNRIELLL